MTVFRVISSLSMEEKNQDVIIPSNRFISIDDPSHLQGGGSGPPEI